MKRALTIFGIVFLVLLVGALVYLYLFLPRGEEGVRPITSLFPSAEEGSGETTAPEKEDAGGYPEIPNESTDTEETPGEIATTSDPLKAELTLLVPEPVSGFQPLTTEEGVLIRYVKRQKGDIFETALLGINTVRISQTKIQDVYDAVWSEDARYFVARFLGDDEETISTYFVDLSTYTKEGGYTLDGKFLIKNIQDFAVPNGSGNILFIADTPGGSLVSKLDFTTGEIAPLFSSPFSEWLIQEPQGGGTYLITKASREVPGYLYRLIPESDELLNILAGIDGLTALVSPEGDFVLYSKSTESGLELLVYDTKEKTSMKLASATLPEKCVWENSQIFYCAVPQTLPPGEYPDDWHQREITFADTIMKFKVGNPRPVKVYPLGGTIDAVSLDIEGSFLYFLDRSSSFLWVRRIKEKTSSISEEMPVKEPEIGNPTGLPEPPAVPPAL